MSGVLEDFSPSALINAIEDNSIKGIKAWGRWRGIQFHEDTDMLWTISSIPHPIFNNVFSAHVEPAEVDATIGKAINRARKRGVTMGWWISPSTRPSDLGKYLEDEGFISGGSATGMAVDLFALESGLPEPNTLSIVEVKSIEEIQSWAKVSSIGFGIPDFVEKAWFNVHVSVGLGDDAPWRLYLASVDEKPIATSALYLGAGVAGIASVATVPEARRQGAGTAVTRYPLMEARRLGYKIGVLWSTEEALSVYRTLGFREYCKADYFMWMGD